MSAFIALSEPNGEQFYVRASAIDTIEPAPEAWQALVHKRKAKTLIHVNGVERAVLEDEFSVLRAATGAKAEAA